LQPNHTCDEDSPLRNRLSTVHRLGGAKVTTADISANLLPNRMLFFSGFRQ
jgi:hypothetical protein